MVALWLRKPPSVPTAVATGVFSRAFDSCSLPTGNRLTRWPTQTPGYWDTYMKNRQSWLITWWISDMINVTWLITPKLISWYVRWRLQHHFSKNIFDVFSVFSWTAHCPLGVQGNDLVGFVDAFGQRLFEELDYVPSRQSWRMPI